MRVPLSFGLSHTFTPTGRLPASNASGYQDFSHELWGLLVFAVGPIRMSVQAKALPALASWNLFGIAKYIFLDRFVPAPLSMPWPGERKRPTHPGLHSVHPYWKAALLRSICRCHLGRYIRWSVCVSRRGSCSLKGPAPAHRGPVSFGSFLCISTYSPTTVQAAKIWKWS